MIGTPSVNWINKRKNKKAKPKFTSNIDCETMMIPEIRPNRLIEIESEKFDVNYGSLTVDTVDTKNASGIYICDSANFIGDNFGGPFGAKVKANGTV